MGTELRTPRYPDTQSMRKNALSRSNRLFLLGVAFALLAFAGFSTGLLLSVSKSEARARTADAARYESATSPTPAW